MINTENLKKLYESVISGTELTTKELNEYGFHSKNITELIKKGILERKKGGYYAFIDVEALFSYGKSLIVQKEYKKATFCFQKCYELNPNHGGACFQLFLRAIRSKKYDEAFVYFSKFYHGNNPFYNADSNFYLYLLNMITEIPEEYKECVQSISFNDAAIRSGDKRYADIPIRNKIRALAFDQKFFSAIRMSDELESQCRSATIQDILIKILLSQAYDAQIKMKKDIIELARGKQYNRIVAYLEKVQERYRLNIVDEHTLFLAKEILNIIETGEHPVPERSTTKFLFTAIQNRDYELALSLSTSHLTSHNISFDDNAIHILLKDIVALMKEKNPLQNQVGSVVKDTTAYKSTFIDILDSLLKQDIDQAFQALRAYLTEIGKRQYDFLIIDLIRMSVVEKDSAFAKPMIALTYISRENFTFDITEYIQNFYEALSRDKFEEARIYLDIIAKSNELGESPIKAQELERTLNTKEEAFYRQNNKTAPEVDESVVEESIRELKSDVTAQTSADDSVASKETQSPQYSIDDESLINSKLDTLRENGIVLLKPMEEERRHRIYKIVNDMPNVSCFPIGTGERKQIVLRQRAPEIEHQKISEMNEEASTAYSMHRYSAALAKYRELLKHLGHPKPYYYATIGLLYLKKHNISLAIDYLTIATMMKDSKYEFRDLIAFLKGDILPEDRKPRVKMSEKDFYNDMDEYYGIKEIDEIADLVSLGMSVDDICIHLGLDEEQKAIVCLILAREAFSQENDVIGDQYLKKVEEIKNKSQFIVKLLKEIRRNKRFYKNRVPKDRIPLFLSFKFKKV